MSDPSASDKRPSPGDGVRPSHAPPARLSDAPSARLVAFEGIDGAGKGTQVAAVAEALRSAGRSVAAFGFPQYDATRFGGWIGRFLRGEFGELADVPPLFAALLFAGDRFESRDRLDELRAGREFLLLDRYVGSNIAHQAARVPLAGRAGFTEELLHLEHEIYRLPRPAETFLFDLPVEAAQRMILAKAGRSYTDEAMDLQEADGEHLAAVRERYLDLAGRLGWQVVAVCREDETRPRPREEITAEVVARLLGPA